MPVTKRHLLQAGLAAAPLAALGRAAMAEPVFAPAPGTWRRFEVVTRFERAAPEGLLQAWFPLPSVSDPGWVLPLGEAWGGPGATVREVPADGARLLHATWPAGTPARFTVTTRFAARDRAVDWRRPRAVAPLSAADRGFYLAPTAHLPLDGVVRATAERVTRGGGSDRAKAEAVYQWVVENTHRDPKVRGCGAGDVRAMLETGDLSGKCADINALFVALLRASGVPAREIFGVRVAPSRFGYRSLGVNTEVVTKAQHCRAEAWLEGYGWTALDPADVRKVVLEEVPGGLPLSDPKVAAVRKALFGGWEANWLPYNHAADVALPGASGERLAYLMYPQAEVDGRRLDCLTPDAMCYSIEAREIA